VTFARVALRSLQASKRWALNCGPFGSKLVQRDYVESGVPVIRGCNLSTDTRFNMGEFVFVTPEKADELLPSNAHAGDLVFTQRGTLGQVGIIPVPSPFPRYVISQSQMKLTVDRQRADPHFVYYVFKAPDTIQRIHNQAFSSGVPHINLEILRDFEIELPEPPIQHRIASILSAYDDLIENNTRRIKILEEMAQMLYREWFVNFRFPGHGKVRMVESELGPIPEGWRVGRLEDAVVLQRGFDLPTAQRVPGNVPIIAATGLTGTHNEAKVKGPGVVTGRSGSLGTVMLVWEDFWPLNTALWAKEFRQSNPIHAYFTLQALDLKGFNSGAAVPTLNRNDIHGLPTVLPDRETLNTLDEYALPLFTLKRNLEAKNRNLRTTRDLLLPKLISGEIPVEAAAELAEQTL
jgi:type I restriction enzyme S subunit